MNDKQQVEERSSVWDTTTDTTWQIDLPVMPSSARVLLVPIESNKATMLIVDVFLECPGKPGGYKTYFVVEWSGAQSIPLRLSSFESTDAPRPKNLQDEPQVNGTYSFSEATIMRLCVRDYTFPGTVLKIGSLSWLDEMPLIPINSAECLLEDFTSTRFWDLADWVMNDRCTLPPDDSGMLRIWFFAQPWYRERSGRFHRISFTKRCQHDIAPFQAVTVSVSIDRRTLFSLIFTIDGHEVAVIDKKRGLGDGEELRIPLSGRELTAITFEMEEVPETAGQSPDQVISAFVRWFALERLGAEPTSANEVRGMPSVEPAPAVEDIDQQSLPVGILFGRDDVHLLRQKIANETGGVRRIYDEILAEAESHLAYQPEPHVGRYLPIDYGNSQGAGRMSAHMGEMYHYNSCMVYSSLIYALSGAANHGEAARRALLSTLRCDEWASGFISRIPVGLPGYRAPFVTSSAACAVALCYDFIYPLLSMEERREVEDTLYSKAIPWLDLYLRLYGEGYLLEGNQGPVYSRGLIYAALVARRSHPDVIPLLDKWVAWFQRMMTTCYEQDGSTNEGPSYWEYTTNETVSALLAIARYLGKAVADIAPSNLTSSMDYMQHMRSLSTETLSFQNIGDCAVRESNFMSGILLFFARHLGDNHAQWLWNTFYAERHHMPGNTFFGTPLGAFVSDALLTFLLHEDGTQEPPQLPPSKRFSVCDRVVWRTGASYGDTLVLFEGGKMIPGHAHNDKGQFLLEAFGERLVADPGMVNYADPAAEILNASVCHNVVTIQERDQSFRDLQRAVVIESLQDTEQYNYLRADLSGSYKEMDLFKRHLLFVRPDYVVVLDDIKSNVGGLQWHLHTAGDLTVNGDSATTSAPKAGMLMLFAASSTLTTKTGEYVVGAERLTSNLTLSPAADVKSVWIAALLIPYSNVVPINPPIAEKVILPDGVRFHVQGAWGVDTVTISHEPEDVRQKDVQPAQYHIHVVRGQHGSSSVSFQIDA